MNHKDLRGSRLRCLMLTSLSREQVAGALTRLASPFASVSPNDRWMPRGFLEPDEPKLGEAEGFLSPDQRKKVTDWWLKVRRKANTPNWDVASTCTFDGRPGLLLIEAKAHDSELRPEGKARTHRTNWDNHRHIGTAIGEANEALNKIVPGWTLSLDSHYQLANRFAWAWKLTSLGIPIILVYLGFLNATEMKDQGESFPAAELWHACMMAHAQGIVPREAWERPFLVGSTPLVALVRSADFSITTVG